MPSWLPGEGRAVVMNKKAPGNSDSKAADEYVGNTPRHRQKEGVTMGEKALRKEKSDSTCRAHTPRSVVDGNFVKARALLPVFSILALGTWPFD